MVARSGRRLNTALSRKRNKLYCLIVWPANHKVPSEPSPVLTKHFIQPIMCLLNCRKRSGLVQYKTRENAGNLCCKIFCHISISLLENKFIYRASVFEVPVSCTNISSGGKETKKRAIYQTRLSYLIHGRFPVSSPWEYASGKKKKKKKKKEIVWH